MFSKIKHKKININIYIFKIFKTFSFITFYSVNQLNFYVYFLFKGI